jgi:hypothetical protein
MTRLVNGHGERVDDTRTFVPIGTKLRFYSAYDVDLASSVALTTLVDGAGAPAVETIIGTGTVGEVANYELTADTDDLFYSQWLALSTKPVSITWVGPEIPDKTRLCEDPKACNGLGHHICLGVLARVIDDDIVIVACRGTAKTNTSEAKYGTDKKNPLSDLRQDTQAFLDGFRPRLMANPAAAEAEIDDMPQGSIAMFLNFNWFEYWQKARYAKDFAVKGDFPGLIGHLTANQADLDDIMASIEEVPGYGDALDEAAVAGAQAFTTALDSAPDQVKKALRTRPIVAAAASSGDWQPDDAALDQITQRNSAAVKATAGGNTVSIEAGGLLVLIGDQHDQKALVYVLRQQGHELGTVLVTKGGAFSKGELQVTGITSQKTLVNTALEAISDKKVIFA